MSTSRRAPGHPAAAPIRTSSSSATAVAAFLFGIFVPKLITAFHARSWPAVACTIEYSAVQTHHGDKTSYSPDVLYRYTYGGKTYRSNDADLMGGTGPSSSAQRV